MILAIVGPHGAGKTTTGRRVAARLGWRWDPEIGLQLRRLALARDPQAWANRPQPDFDLHVFQQELARDACSGGLPRVVETWHPGNLAYARRRSPTVARAWEERLASAARSAPGWVQPLTCDRAELYRRRSEPGGADIVDFFLEVGREAEAIARAWDLLVLPPIDTSRLAPGEVVERVLEALARRTG